MTIRYRSLLIRSRSLFAGVAVAGLLAGPASAATIHLDNIDDFNKTWFKRWNSTASAVQGAGVAVLSGASGLNKAQSSGRNMNRFVMKQYIPTHELSSVFLVDNMITGGFELSAVKFATVNGRTQRVGIVSLGRDVGGALDLSGIDWGAADEIRFRFVLDEGAKLNLDSLEVQASAAGPSGVPVSAVPEPSAALLMGMGFLVTGAHMRLRRTR